jgi:hypothetical protein
MKHHIQEQKREAAQRYLKTWARKRTGGVYLPHLYDQEIIPRTHGWWDDFFVKCGSQVLAVWWTHPRMDYKDACETLAHERVAHLYPDRDGTSWLEGGTKVYKYLGKNKKRKKVVATQIPNSRDTSFFTWIEALRAAEEDILANSDIVIRPNYNITQRDWCRGMDICWPEEIITQEDALYMAYLAHDCARDHTLFQYVLDDRFSNYTYTAEDWRREFPKAA